MGDLVVEALTRTDDTLVDRLEALILQLPVADVRTIHEFRPGVYERTMIAPPWSLITGARHKTPCVTRVEKGSVAVSTDRGVALLVAPSEFKVEPGLRRVGRVFDEELIWTDVYDNPDDCHDIDVLDERHFDVPAIGMFANRTPEQHHALMLRAKEVLCLQP